MVGMMYGLSETRQEVGSIGGQWVWFEVPGQKWVEQRTLAVKAATKTRNYLEKIGG